DAVRRDSDFVWSGPLVDLLGRLPAEEVRPVLRGQWANFGLRDAILLQLADKPEVADRDQFLAGLESTQQQVVQRCLAALEQLPRDARPEGAVAVLRLLRHLLLEPKEQALRARVLALLGRQTGLSLSVKEEGTDAAVLKRLYQPLFDDLL